MPVAKCEKSSLICPVNFDRIFAWPLTSLEVFMNLSLPSQYQFLPRFFRLATIAVLSNMMVPLAGLVDTAFLGHLEDIDYLAGVILGSILFDYLYRVLKFLRTSTTALTAQAVGEEDQAEVWVAGLRSALVALLLG